MIQELLKFGSGLLALPQRKIRLSTYIRRVEKATFAELRLGESEIVGGGIFEEFESLGRAAITNFQMGSHDGQPIMIEHSV